MSANKRRALSVAICIALLTGCHPRSYLLEPKICYSPLPAQFQNLPPSFTQLTQEEEQQEWGREVKIGIVLARGFDLYRAITCFKRALILMPDTLDTQRKQIEYYVMLAYYIGGKYDDAIASFEQTSLSSVTSSFPVFREILIILYDAYLKTGQCEKAGLVMRLMDKGDPETSLDLKLSTALEIGDLTVAAGIACQTNGNEEVSTFIGSYCSCKKSVRTAQTLNALFPGAGYAYVGQKKTALTSFLINTAFVAATWHFVEQKNWGAAVIAGSLECGWYFGGINGAGLAAKQYNELYYEKHGRDLMIRKRLFPVLMLETSF